MVVPTVTYFYSIDGGYYETVYTCVAFVASFLPSSPSIIAIGPAVVAKLPPPSPPPEDVIMAAAGPILQLGPDGTIVKEDLIGQAIDEGRLC